MKVALVCDWFAPRIGGIELHLQSLGARLMAAGHDVVVITPTPGETLIGGMRVRRIHAPLAPGFGFLITAGGVRALGAALAEEHADVAHCHVSIVSPAALGGAQQAQRLGVPTVLTFHSVVPQTPVLAKAVDFALGTSRWRARFSAVSQRVAKDVQPIAGLNEMIVVPNGIDVGFWRTRSADSASAARRGANVRLVSVMRLNQKKRPLALVEIMRRAISSSGTSTNVTLKIAGDGPQRRALQHAINRARLSSHIELLGRRTHEDIRILLNDSDVFVLPTVRESFGLAALEARCAGVPVVAMAASGVSEFIAHGREGLLAKSDAEFADHVATLVRDETLRRTIADNNRETLPPYDWPQVIDQHLTLYREAIALRNNV
ncbi:MAG TPA: glycosyltransferase family 4 protein [Gemmatimonadaceae bacterium]